MLGFVAQPRADTRQRELDDYRQDDRLNHLTPGRRQDIEPGIDDQKRRRRG
jgi:hypothetical protein